MLTSLWLGLCAVAANLSAGPIAEVDPNGGLTVRYGGMPIFAGDSLLLMDAAWKDLDPAIKSPAKITRDGGIVTTVRSGEIISLTRIVDNSGDGPEIRYDITMKPDPRGKNVELCLGIPAALLDHLPAAATTHGVQHSDQELKLPMLGGDVTLDLRGSTSAWNLDDLRQVAWSGNFRLRFSPAYDPAQGLTATAVLRISASPSTLPGFLSLDVAAHGNRTLRDGQAEDGQGGWTDQGENDLRALTPGRRATLGVPLATGDRAVILRGGERPAYAEVSAPVQVDGAVARVYLFHTSAWPAEFRQVIATYQLRYADGQTLDLPVRNGVDVSDWWGANEPLEGRVAWSGDNGHQTVGVYCQRWDNPRPDVPLTDIVMRSANASAVPIWLGATAVRTGGLTPAQVAMLDQVWNDRAVPAVDTSGWFPAPIAWRDGISPGSALDVSFLNDAPAGRHGFLTVRDGHFVFAGGDGRPVRFWGTNAALNGPFPDQADAPGIAACLARQGVNLVRLHLYAIYENTLIAPDGSLDLASLDRFCRFIAELKAAGIYTYLDLNDGMLYDRLVGHPLPGNGGALKLASLFDPELIAAQQKLAQMLFTTVNPYTKLRLCDDPAIALYEITNENSLTMGWGTLKEKLSEPYYQQLEGLWRAWLKDHGQPARELPATLGGGDDLSRRFGAELQGKYLATMQAYFRQLGVKAPICGTNITFTLGDLWASRDLDYTNDHAYADHPNVNARPMTYSNRPTVNAPVTTLRMIPSFAKAKLAGKPLVASEWNYCFPNDYRCEGLPQMAAYAAYQDWDGLLFYCATGSFDAGRWSRFHDNPAILIHSQQCDPATWGLSQLCALLYRRGDVRIADKVVRLSHGPAKLWADKSDLSLLPFLPALARVEAELTADDRPAPLGIDLAAPVESRYAQAIAALGNQQANADHAVSDTGQLVRDADPGTFTVDTPATQMATGFLARRGEIRLGALWIDAETRFTTIAATSLDGQPLTTSKRILLAAVGNARNTGTVADGRQLAEVGRAPVLAEPVEAAVGLAAEQAGELQVYALDTLTGERRGTVPAQLVDGVLTFAIGPEQRTIYYELAR